MEYDPTLYEIETTSPNSGRGYFSRVDIFEYAISFDAADR
jgi:hypothetical protein